MYKYRLHYEDGGDTGAAEYAGLIKPDETIWTGEGPRGPLIPAPRAAL